MKDEQEIKKELIDELILLRSQIADLKEAAKKSKQMEERLRESEELFKRIFNEIPIGISTVGADFRFIRTNKAFCTMTGYEERELTALTFRDLTHPDHVATDVENVTRVLNKEIPFYQTEKRYIRKDKAIVWGKTIVSSIFDLSGQFQHFLAMTEDITERKRMEEELRKSEIRYRRITETITDYIYTVRIRDGRAIETRHGAGCRIVTGYSEQEFRSDPHLWINMVAVEDRPAVIDQAKGALAGKKVSPLEHRIIHKRGVLRWVRNTIVLRYDPQERLHAYDGLIQDITDRKQAEAEREKLIAELQKAMSEVKKLSGFLPICASCKKIRNDEGYWQQIESYIKEHSEAEFSHGMCPDCGKKYYPEYFQKRGE
ncbi:MAG: PAS domain S-box protein [Deltaproteobacteria bacterium]|nr:PAS domain S-box protein [Deltaproteobacteria bacterium]